MTYLELIGSMEFWAGFEPNDILNDASLKETFTDRLNRSLDRYQGMLGTGSRLAQSDDTNFDNQPFSFFDIVDGRHDYQFLEDEDGNSISDITAVLIKTGDRYGKIDQIFLDDADAELVMSPNPKPGIPTRFIERNNTVFLDPVPNYDLEDGGKLFYKRAPSYFIATDTTKRPGFPFNFHEMLAVRSSLDWLLVRKPSAATQIQMTLAEMQRWEEDFRVYRELRNPQSRKLRMRRENNR